MKRKISKIFGVGLALVLVLSLSLVMAVPLSALTEPVVTVAPTTAGQTAEYTIVFTTTEDLAVTAGDDIRIEFPELTTVPSSYDAADITINTIDAGTEVESVVGRKVTINVPEDVVKGPVTVVFKSTADIVNPSVIAAYTLEVSTSREVTPVLSAEYNITAPPGPVDVYNAADPMVYQETYDTITAALDHGGIGAGWTVKVHADIGSGGNYDSSLETYEIDIDVVGVIVESYDGAATTTIDASAETTARAAVKIWNNDVTLGGDGVGFTIIAPDATEGMADRYGVELHIDGTMSGVTVEGNTIQGSTNTDSNSPQIGIHLWGEATFSSLTVKDNTLTTTYATDCTDASPGNWETSSAMTIGAAVVSVGGTFDGNFITGFSVGMNLDELDAATTIHDNIVDSCDLNAISVTGSGDIDIYDNEFKGCGANGLAIDAVSDVDVYNNSIYGNGNGIRVDGDAENVLIQYNDIYSNTNTTLPAGFADVIGTYENYGVLNNDTGIDLDAKYNFWGEIGGPSADAEALEADQSEALGNGDIVSKDVTYNPWLSVSYEMVVDEGIRYYGSDTLTLQEGWNTLSVPLKLYDYANTITEIENMGDFLTAENYSDLIYEYDPVDGWVEPTTVLTPCRGYYIKMLEDSNFPVFYSNSLGLPALELAAGWNLIGSAFGIDKLNGGTWAVDDPDVSPVEAVMVTGYALDSIGAQVSVVVSPSAPGQIGDPWSEIWVVGDNGNNMYTGEGYWVFMTDIGTLAGFEITPFYFTP